ncbi:MAG: uracil-DNA glycosylase family protein [Pseudomonadota bacterium]
MQSLGKIFSDIRACRLCADQFNHKPRPVIRGKSSARLLIVGQAPGSRVHATGIPFNDPSGVRLREWLKVDADTFYDESKIALMPMAFCYPGSSKQGDAPPPLICAQTWRTQLLAALPNIEFTLIVGRYAIDWHLPEYDKRSIADTVKDWAEMLPDRLATPHPSPRNNRWLKQNTWFEKDCVPALQKRVRQIL